MYWKSSSGLILPLELLLQINYVLCRSGPHGVVDFLNEETKTIETRQSISRAELKRSNKTPFPQPLLTRHTYKQNVPQPPLRNIFRRIRRSRRNARLNMNSTSKEIAAKGQSAVNSHKLNCRCGLCLSKRALVKSRLDADKRISCKRKADSKSSAPESVKKMKMANCSSSNSHDELRKNETSTSHTMASPLKHLLPRKSIEYDSPVQHTPAIKIKYKSPAGRGRIINIPSKPHNGTDFNVGSSNSDFETSKIKKALPNKKLSYVGTKNPNRKFSTPDQLQLLKRITDVKIQDVTNEIASQLDEKCSQNEYLVFVKHDSKMPKKKLRAPQTGSNKKLPIQPKKKTSKKSMANRTKASAFKHNNSLRTDSSLISSDPAPKRQLRIILQPLTSSKTDLSTLNKKSTESNSKQLQNSKTSPNQDTINKKVISVKKTPSPKSHTMYVTTCKDISGTIYAQGDVVWSKLCGYPWWPSRIIKLIVTKTDGEILQQEAMVSWFCSATTSIIPLSSIQPFEKSFDVRYFAGFT